MDNTAFLATVSRSFLKFLETDSKSNKKLIILHGEIAADLFKKLNLSKKASVNYTIQSLGFEAGKEGQIQGRYINKNVDIVVLNNQVPIAGIAVKFVMQNYSQNSNNYFENMLGETVNIRSVNIPYFQIFIIADEIPYYSNKNIKKWETFTLHNASKYQILAKDNTELSTHTPTKTLLYVVNLPVIDKEKAKNAADYKALYQAIPNFEITNSNTNFGYFASSVIFNDYETFMDKVLHRILSI